MTMRRLAADLASSGLAARPGGAALLALCLWHAGSAGTAEDGKVKAYGKHLAQECTGCHRIDGIDNGIPSIVGWNADAFVATLKFYQSGARTQPGDGLGGQLAR